MFATTKKKTIQKTKHRVFDNILICGSNEQVVCSMSNFQFHAIPMGVGNFFVGVEAFKNQVAGCHSGRSGWEGEWVGGWIGCRIVPGKSPSMYHLSRNV